MNTKAEETYKLLRGKREKLSIHFSDICYIPTIAYAEHAGRISMLGDMLRRRRRRRSL